MKKIHSIDVDNNNDDWPISAYHRNDYLNYRIELFVDNNNDNSEPIQIVRFILPTSYDKMGNFSFKFTNITLEYKRHYRLRMVTFINKTAAMFFNDPFLAIKQDRIENLATINQRYSENKWSSNDNNKWIIISDENIFLQPILTKETNGKHKSRPNIELFKLYKTKSEHGQRINPKPFNIDNDRKRLVKMEQDASLSSLSGSDVVG